MIPDSPFHTCRWGFPPIGDWPDDDVVAVGADLEPDTLLYAYSHGMFPMYLGAGNRELAWWSPVQRGVIELDGLRISRSLRRSIGRYRTTVNGAFRAVIEQCATARTDGNWISSSFIDAYCALHELGWAHSVEVWDEGVLVGGLYGVRIEGFFAGESMFHSSRDASKVALVHLVELMSLDGMSLLDTQWCTEHLASLGCVEIPRVRYLSLLESATGIAILDL